ncbi:GntR family transcriptional regulator [Methylovirgula sp. 4M-Z18]|uniref:GntR family transcriptional regulator n=1 Tax=Methylovirgula sp. 4M-Z18 TaxID=2293567 RepID=UPI000E2EC032|nr:GntR family transcriptional regulator [Methylovirgula sp. 4M-Z18]RFB81554.1 GntR family transcriptional regulator [Methylovirgula sp. 4M-Z18]
MERQEAEPAPLWPLDPIAPVGPQIHALLRQQIIRSELLPGTALSEAEIARRCSTSRQPVREAFIKLAEEGLLEVRPQRGTFVRKINKAAVLDARFVREAIEAEIVRELAGKSNKDLIVRLRRQLAEQAATPNDRPDDFMRLDEEFHRTLADAAGRLYGWKVIEDVKIHMDRVRHLSLRTFPQDKLVQQHTAIVDAVERASPQEAEAAMRRHLRAILDDLPPIAAQYPSYFTSPG